MSVLLTASRCKPKSAKPKKKKVARVPPPPPQFNPVPPISTPKTRVWYWLLENVPTTVMFTAETSEVWCNGFNLDTLDAFTSSEDGDGGVIDFCIYVEESQTSHKARIMRTLGERGAMNHDLYCDGHPVPEHTEESQHEMMMMQQQQQYGYDGYDQHDGYYANGGPSNYNGYEGYEEQEQQEYDYSQEAENPPTYEEAVGGEPEGYYEEEQSIEGKKDK